MLFSFFTLSSVDGTRGEAVVLPETCICGVEHMREDATYCSSFVRPEVVKFAFTTV